MSRARESLVMIGNGMAGIACLEKLIERDPERYAITVFGDEPHPNYNRIKLSAVLAQNADPADLTLNSEAWYPAHGITLKMGVRATRVDPAERVVHGQDGSKVAYDKLIFATGSRPFVPPIEGINGPGVATFRTLEDCENIARATITGSHAVVIGGGLLGLEAAHGLRQRGMTVTVVHRVDRLMEQQLDPEAAHYLKTRLEKRGFAFCLNAETKKVFRNNEQITGVLLADGTHLTADMVVVCTGIVPNAELAKACGLPVGRGIVVDDHLTTGDPRIFAVGECAEHNGRVYGLVAPLFDQGRVLAAHLTGESAAYTGSQVSTKLKVAGIDLFSGGRFMLPEGTTGFSEIIERTPDTYRKLVIREVDGVQVVQGTILFGHATGASRLFRMMTEGTPIEGPPQALLAVPAAVAGESEAAAEVAALADSDTVCECNSVSRGEIISAIKAENLCSRDAVMACTKASSSCGSCAPLVEALLVKVQGKKAKVAPRKAKGPPAEETFKTKKHPLDCWEDILKFARENTGPPAKEWGFRLRWFGLFWEGPRSETFMLRIKVTGGRISATQLRGVADLADACGLPHLDVTTRQGIQIRGIPVAHVPPVFKELEALGLTSMQSGADNVRNLTACAQSGIAPDEIADVSPLVARLKAQFVGNRAFANLPRKFNISVSGCGTNCTHPELHDIAVQAVRDENHATVYTLRVGGQPSTSHFVSQDLQVLLTEDEVPEVCAAIACVYRDHGDRTNRKKARMSHLIEKWGLRRFRESVEKSLGRELPRHASGFVIREQEQDPIGVHLQKQDGLSFVGLPFSVGKVTVDQARALARLADEYGSGELRTTNRQNILLINIPNGRISDLQAELDREGIPYGGSPLRAGVTACSGNTYCKLATVETKNRVASMVDHLEGEGLADQPLNIALSACPNTCANHSVADIGLQGCKTRVDGEVVEAFHVFFGGGTGDDPAFGKHALRQVPGDRINEQLAYAVRVYQKRRQGDESFKAFCERYSADELAQLFQPWTYPTSRPVRWLAERIARMGGDELTTYV